MVTLLRIYTNKLKRLHKQHIAPLNTRAPDTCSAYDYSYMCVWCMHLTESYIKQAKEMSDPC